MEFHRERTFVSDLRRQFPALGREWSGYPVAYLDGPAGTQAPQSVIDVVAHHMAHRNANVGGVFATSRETNDAMTEGAQAFADFFGASDPDEIAFGPNATTLTFALSRALARTWQTGDEIVVTDLDHDANVSPWVLAARDRGVEIRRVRIRTEDCTLDLDDLQSKLGARTRLVALGAASNSVGTRNPVSLISDWVRQTGALLYVDAVHLAPHALVDVQQLGCDFLVCSAYKFYGPHVGILWGKRRLLEAIEAYKVRPAPDDLPGKWMTGTQNHPCIAGARAAVDYLADLGRSAAGAHLPRRQALQKAYTWIESYEGRMVRRLLDGLAGMRSYRVFGICDPLRDSERLPTVSLRHRSKSPEALAQHLADHGVFAWHGNYYALRLSEVLEQEPSGTVRLGFVHYNTFDEVDRTLELLSKFA